MKTITKAVFPVAGLGSRFLPATKASPKEMLPIVDKPLIQYAVEEAVAAGIHDLVFITGRNKRAIEDHFDKAYELEAELAARAKTDLLDAVQTVVPKHINCIYIRQTEALGLGHAVLCARPVIDQDPFAVILADDLVDAEPGVIKQMVNVFAEKEASILGVQRIARQDTGSYGIVSCEHLVDRLGRIDAIVEKPKPDAAPSTLAVVGRYILTPRVFDHLATQEAGAGGEIQLTDGIARLLQGEPVYAYEFEGVRYDCGNKLGYLEATVAYGLRHPEVGPGFRRYLAKLSDAWLAEDARAVSP